MPLTGTYLWDILEEDKVRYEHLVYFNDIRWLDGLNFLRTKTKDLELKDSKTPILLGPPVSLRFDFLSDLTNT